MRHPLDALVALAARLGVENIGDRPGCWEHQIDGQWWIAVNGHEEDAAMSERTNIAWTEATWNPVTGCSKVSPGCANCYAEALSLRYGWTTKPWTPENAAENVVLHPDRFGIPLRWKQPRRVFVNSMSDLFHERVRDDFIDRVFAVMALCGGDRYRCRGSNCKHDDDSRGCWRNNDGRKEPVHTFQILTKRPERMRDYLLSRTDWRGEIEEKLNDPEWPVGYELAEEIAMTTGWPLPNVWLGVSVENQRMADERIPLLLETPAAVRFLSCEPLLAPLDLTRAIPCSDCDGSGHLGRCRDGRLQACETCGGHEDSLGSGIARGLDWVIIDGESGPNRREMDLDWARDIVRQCDAAGVPVFFKQRSGLRPGQPSGDAALDARKEMP